VKEVEKVEKVENVEKDAKEVVEWQKARLKERLVSGRFAASVRS
jgi:hypothetical protein